MTLAPVWLGRSLNQARRAAGKTLEDAAACLASNKGAMSRYETGRMAAKPSQVEALLDLYGVRDPRRRDVLVELSRDACRRGWWDRWWDGYDGDLCRPFIDRAWLEARASMIRSYDTMTIPGLVQTPEYAEVVIRADHPETDDRHVERVVQFLIERQRVLGKQRAPGLSIILDECVLHRPIGGRQILAGQLQHIAELMESRVVELRVLPHSTRANAGQRGAFQLFDLPEPYAKVGYVETIAGPAYVESDGVNRFVRAYDELHTAALGPQESARLIERAAGEFTPASSRRSVLPEPLKPSAASAL